MDACCYQVRGTIIFICPSCNFKWKYKYYWMSTDNTYAKLVCVECKWSTVIHMLTLLSEDWVDYHFIIENTWDYVTSRPENENAVEGKVTWEIVTK